MQVSYYDKNPEIWVRKLLLTHFLQLMYLLWIHSCRWHCNSCHRYCQLVDHWLCTCQEPIQPHLHVCMKCHTPLAIVGQAALTFTVRVNCCKRAIHCNLVPGIFLIISLKVVVYMSPGKVWRRSKGHCGVRTSCLAMSLHRKTHIWHSPSLYAPCTYSYPQPSLYAPCTYSIPLPYMHPVLTHIPSPPYMHPVLTLSPFPICTLYLLISPALPICTLYLLISPPYMHPVLTDIPSPPYMHPVLTDIPSLYAPYTYSYPPPYYAPCTYWYPLPICTLYLLISPSLLCTLYLLISPPYMHPVLTHIPLSMHPVLTHIPLPICTLYTYSYLPPYMHPVLTHIPSLYAPCTYSYPPPSMHPVLTHISLPICTLYLLISPTLYLLVSFWYCKFKSFGIHFCSMFYEKRYKITVAMVTGPLKWTLQNIMYKSSVMSAMIMSLVKMDWDIYMHDWSKDAPYNHDIIHYPMKQ